MLEPLQGTSGLGPSVALTFLSLGLVCLLAYVGLRWLGGLGRGKGTPVVRVLARCPLEPRRSVVLLESVGRYFLVGVGDTGMSLIAELSGDEVRPALAAHQQGPAPWAGLLAKWLPGPRHRAAEPKTAVDAAREIG